MTQFDKRNISMMMDLYEMTMANGYFANQQKTQKVVFDVFYRKNPDQGGYAVFAGLSFSSFSAKAFCFSNFFASSSSFCSVF